MKISQKFVAFSEYMNFNEINKYLGRKIHRVNEFIFFFKFGVRTICLTYAYLIRAKKVRGSQFVDPINDEQV